MPAQTENMPIVSRGGLSDRLRQARRSAGLSQNELACRLGIRRAAVTQWESQDGTLPSMINLIQTAVETSVSCEWLATGRGAMRLGEPEVPAFSAACIARDAEEESLLGMYRRLNHRQQASLLCLLSGLKVR